VRVVGGVYRETCAVPSVDGIVGSGLRAAAVLRSVDPEVGLVTAIDKPSQDAFDAVVEALSLEAPINLTAVPRNERVGFSYFTPLSTPAVNGGRSRMEPIVVEGDAVLVFRMIESGETQIRGRSVVLDPQQQRDLVELDLSLIDSKRLAIVANRSETLALGGADDHGLETVDENTLVAAATHMLGEYGAEVVVVKRAAQGSLVVTASGFERVGVFPTERVYPIGSGDVFAAAFAWAWGERGQEPVAAARVGSRVAAEWCRTRDLSLGAFAYALEAQTAEIGPVPVTVYLAAPFFSLGELWVVNLVRDALISLGATVFSPFHDVGRGGDEVARADLDGLERCDVILALLEGNDPGTVFEAGWARRDDKPVVGYAHRPDIEGGKMLRGSGGEIYGDLSTAVYRSIWAGMAVAGG
jgi:pfkB family carbohydrate kinase/Nucleoside 2-deoxyribosyltransferase